MVDTTTQVKVCGLTSVGNAEACVAAGVSAIGLNFWEGTPRRVDIDVATAIVRTLGSRVEIVGVFVDATTEDVQALRRRVGFRWVQLHGGESPRQLRELLPSAYKAVGIRDASDIDAALRFPGERLLLDARVVGAMPGGTGHSFDWDLAIAIAAQRVLTLAGGLHPGNVAEAVTRVRPAWVDVASGVESAPGIKDIEKVRAFVRAAESV